MKKKLLNIIPSYAYFPLVMAVLLNFLVYNGSNILVGHLPHYNFTLKIDEMIPFIPEFISIYLLAFISWIIGYIIIARESEEVCFHYLSAEMIAKLICFVFFLILPSTIVRPEIIGNGVLASLAKLVYFVDEPVTLFPSIHCLESWMCFRGSIHLKKVPSWYKYVMFISAILVFLSTVFVKQHVFIDIIGGILVVEISLWLARKFNTAKILRKISYRKG